MDATTTAIFGLVTTSDWVLIGTTLLLAAVAFIAPYAVERWKYKFYSAKLKLEFRQFPPDCHKTKMSGPSVSYPVYYFRIKVANTGRIQADQCEVVLEKIWKENSAGNLKEWTGFSPVSLKWSGTLDSKYLTIQPAENSSVILVIFLIHLMNHIQYFMQLRMRKTSK